MKKPETKLKIKVMADLRGTGAWVEKIQQVGIVGTPDLLVCRNGYFIGIELKKDELSLISKTQVLKLRKIKKAGGLAYIVTPENWKEVLKQIISLTSAPFL